MWAMLAAGFAAVAVVAIGVVALTGGGDDGDEAAPAETTTPAEAPTPAPEAADADAAATEDQFSQVAIGQTQDEVRAILGEPEASETDLGGTRECWYFGLSEPGGGHTVCFDQDGLVMQLE